MEEYLNTPIKQLISRFPEVQQGLNIMREFSGCPSSKMVDFREKGQEEARGGRNPKSEREVKMTGKKFNKDMVIGEVLKINPNAIKVIQKYFGQGCFACPGMNMESVSFGAMMHNIDPEVVMKELNELEG